MKKSYPWAITFTALYVGHLVLALTFFNLGHLWSYLISQIFMAVFLFQSFILLHEYGHQSMFPSRSLNTFFGVIAGFFTFIPYHNWKFIHKLHHRWTGWRDKDPTQEKVFIHLLKPAQIKIIDFAWKYHIPIFGFGYRIGTYWTLDKLRRHLAKDEYNFAKWSLAIHIVLYLTILILFPKAILAFLPAAILSFMVTDQITLSQHSHIKGNVSQGQEVAPFPVKEQTIHTRSVLFHPWVSKYIFYNINLHKEHHAYPQLPCYYLNTVTLPESSHSPTFAVWRKKSRELNGSELIFNSHPDCDF